jgi:hypothetical protein
MNFIFAAVQRRNQTSGDLSGPATIKFVLIELLECFVVYIEYQSLY